MRIVLATPLFPPDIGGPATDSAAVSSSLTHAGIESVICTFGTVRGLPRIVRHVWYARALFRSSRGASGIVAFDTVSVGVPAMIIARLRRIPLIVRVPGDYAWEQGVQRFGVTDTLDVFLTKKYVLPVEVLRTAQRLVVRSATLVLSPSDYFASIIRNWGVPEERVKRIYLGVPADRRHASIPETTGKVFFSLGRLVPWKGFPLLLELLVRFPEWHLVLAGDGPDRIALEERAHMLGVSNRVQFLGSISHEEVMSWFARADAFVYNTAWESFSFQVLEALMQGVPIITTRVGSLPELIEDGVEGVLCPYNDIEAFVRAIKTIESEPDVWNKRREAARRKAAMFSLSESANKTVETIRMVCT